MENRLIAGFSIERNIEVSRLLEQFHPSAECDDVARSLVTVLSAPNRKKKEWEQLTSTIVNLNAR